MTALPLEHLDPVIACVVRQRLLKLADDLGCVWDTELWPSYNCEQLAADLDQQYGDKIDALVYLDVAHEICNVHLGPHNAAALGSNWRVCGSAAGAVRGLAQLMADDYIFGAPYHNARF